MSGRWAFCSGITHADVLFAGCVLEDRPAVVALPTEQLQILDTWHTLGLRGTGSHDTVAEEVFVPDDRVLSIFDGPVIDRPLYRFPPFGFFAACITAAAMGNARAAIDNFVELACTKKGVAASRTLAERSTIQVAVATAESALEAARAGYYQAIESAWQASRGRARGAVGGAHAVAPRGNAWGARLGRRRSHRCTTSPGAAPSTTAHRCNDACATRSPLPRTSR